jgi:hypothetical protein
MLGSMPTMPAPIYPQSYPVQGYPPAYASAPSWQGGATYPQQSAAPAPRLAQAPALPRPIVRAKGADDPPRPALPAPLMLPSPEQLGISRPLAALNTLDWTDAHRRLDQLGAVCFHLEKLPQGGYRFTCLLPTAEAAKRHRVEATGATEADVVRLALDQSEQWSRSH